MAGFTNAARFSRRLRAIPPAVRKAVRDQLRANAEDLVQGIQRAVPVEDGTLRSTVENEDTSNERRIRQTVRAGGERTTRPVRKSAKGNAPTYDYALAQEFGTSDMPANPFFYPTYRAKRKAFKRALNAAVKKAVASTKTP